MSRPLNSQIDGVFVLGMVGSGVEMVGEVIALLGLRPIDTGPQSPLTDFNDRLLAFAGGCKEQLPAIGPEEVVRALSSFREEAQYLFGKSVTSMSLGDQRPWVWADPSLSLLASFWQDALGVSPGTILVHRNPAELGRHDGGLQKSSSNASSVVMEWDRFNRAAMAQSFRWPSAVLGYNSLLRQTKTQVELLVDFLGRCGVTPVDGGIDSAVKLIASAENSDATDISLPPDALTKDHRTLDRILNQMDGLHVDPDQWKANKALLDEVATFYDEDYYGASYDTNGIPYSRDEEHWVSFFKRIATSIVTTIQPRSLLDVGCATGMLVEALRNQGVDARGIDVSTWAIEQVPETLRQYCSLGSIAEEIEGRYDLITCIEVAEHLPTFSVDEAIGNLCRHTDAVLFSSTPDDFDEPTHLNVESSGYWSEIFARHGFLRDVDFDASFLAAHAILFRRSATDLRSVIYQYERVISEAKSASIRGDSAVVEHAKLADRYNALAHEKQDLFAEYSRLADQLQSLSRLHAESESRRKAELHAAHERIATLEAGSHTLYLSLLEREAQIDAIHRTKTFRYTAILRRIYTRLRQQTHPPQPVVQEDERSYANWVKRFDTIDDSARVAIRRRLDQMPEQPLVSILLPVYNTPKRYLTEAIESVRSQIYTNWELCIADDASTLPHVAKTIADFAAQDSRIRVTTRSENGHISAASNTALEMASGEWITPLDHDDVLAEHALALAMLAAHDNADAGVIYSDEDKIDDKTGRQLPYFKPDFDPLLLLGQNYLTHLLFIKRDLVTAAGGYRLGFEGSQDWDLILRVTERLEPSQVIHVPHILYHWRIHDQSTASLVSNKPYALDAGERSVVEHLDRMGLHGEVSRIPSLGHNRVKWQLPQSPPLVSIIIPTKDGTLLKRCIDSLLAFTSYPNFEILVVDNGSQEFATLEYLRQNEQHLTVIRDERPFNYSALNNAAVKRASGSVLCLLNDDTEVIAGDWLDEMVSQLLMPGVGAVGAKLFYPDGRIQHAGVIVGLGGVAGHSHRMSDRLAPGYCGRLLVAQNLSAVTGACMVVRREAWDQVGGLEEENLAIAFNDVDFGLRLRQAGWRVVWTPFATLYHHESVSRGPDDVGPRIHGFAKEIEFIKERWGESLLHDPFYNPNLTLDSEDFALAWPPGVSYR